MPNICLQFGQCGNQLGYQIFDTLYSDNFVKNSSNQQEIRNVLDDWFHFNANGNLEARSIMVDTEDKVISDLHFKGAGKSWGFRKDNSALYLSGGSGNNWAIGYFEKAPKIAEVLHEKIQLECEKCDRFEGFLNILSSAGGTGSGIGSYACQLLKDEYPKNTMVSCLVLPHSSGEVTVQNYNTILALSQLYDQCDSIITFSNDYLQKICSHILHVKCLMYEDLNKVISGQISCLFTGCSDENSLVNSIPLLSLNPDYKILNMKGTPYSDMISFGAPLKWEAILTHMKIKLSKSESDWEVKPTWKFNSSVKSRKYDYYKSICNLIACCGNEIQQGTQIANNMFDIDDLYVRWMSRNERFMVSAAEKRIQGRDKFCALLSNNNVLNEKFNEVTDKAWKCFIHNAFAHHFNSNGTSSEDFVHAFVKLESIIQNYAIL